MEAHISPSGSPSVAKWSQCSDRDPHTKATYLATTSCLDRIQSRSDDTLTCLYAASAIQRAVQILRRMLSGACWSSLQHDKPCTKCSCVRPGQCDASPLLRPSCWNCLRLSLRVAEAHVDLVTIFNAGTSSCSDCFSVHRVYEETCAAPTARWNSECLTRVPQMKDSDPFATLHSPKIALQRRLHPWNCLGAGSS